MRNGLNGAEGESERGCEWGMKTKRESDKELRRRGGSAFLYILAPFRVTKDEGPKVNACSIRQIKPYETELDPDFSLCPLFSPLKIQLSSQMSTIRLS